MGRVDKKYSCPGSRDHISSQEGCRREDEEEKKKLESKS